MRAPIFTAREVLQFAVKNEQEGAAFYRKIAERTAESPVRKMFLLLAGEETRHARIFKRMLSKADKSETVKSDLDEYAGYMIAYYTANILFAANQTEALSSPSGPIAALDFGIQRELDSIVYYTQAKELVSASQAESIDKIIAEERSHFLKFSKLKQKFLEKSASSPNAEPGGRR